MRFGLSIPLLWQTGQRRSATGLVLGRPPAQTGVTGLLSDQLSLALFWILECVSEINFAYA